MPDPQYPSTLVYPQPEFADRILRRKDDTATADPDYAALQRSPDVVRLTVGGTASDGDYEIEVIPVDTANVPTPDPVVFTRAAAEANAAIATGLDAELETAIATSGDLYRYYSASTVSTTNIDLTLRHDAPRHTLVLTAPGTGTLVATPDDTYPIAMTQSPVRSHDAHSCGELAVVFLPVNSSDAPIPNDTACTLDVEIVRVVERRMPHDTPNASVRTVGVTSSDLVEDHDLNDELRVPFDGGRFTVRIAAVTNPPSNLDAIEIRVRPVHT